MTEIQPPAQTLRDASIRLSGYEVLTPGTTSYERLYVERPKVESRLLLEATRAARAEQGEKARRCFHWCFSGHNGSGKSTELNRILGDPDLSAKYLATVVDLAVDFNLHNLDYTDLILAMGKAVAQKADEVGCAIPKKLEAAISNWGAEIFTEEEKHIRSEGRVGLKVSLPFLILGEEVRSGGGQRELIRRNISTNILGFIRLIDELSETLSEHSGRQVLCVLDSLDHMDAKSIFELLDNHFETITQPKISKIIVIPLSLLNTSFMATIKGQFSTVLNIKVFTHAGSEEIDKTGLAFYEDVISRYVPLNLLTEEARVSLFRLSAGVLRDMIRYTGNACAYAYEEGASHVTNEHAEKVWYEVMRFYRAQLYEADYEVLRKVQKKPYIEGIDGVAKLLNSKAVVFYPNNEGWYGVHPAIRRMIGAPDARANG